MARGRPPIPIEVKRRRGTLRPGRLPSGEAGLHGVAPIDTDAALSESLPEALDRAVAAAPWLAFTDAPKLALLRELAEQLDQGSIRDRVHALRLCSRMLDELGMSPTARARLGLAEIRSRSKLEELRSGRS